MSITTPDPYTGEETTLLDLARRYGMHKVTLLARYQAGVRGLALIAETNHHRRGRSTEELMRSRTIHLISIAALRCPLRQVTTVQQRYARTGARPHVV